MTLDMRQVAGLAGAAAIGLGVAFGVYLWQGSTSNGRSEMGGKPLSELRIPANNAALAEKGRGLYAQACADCHGLRLQGEPNWRQRRADGTLPAPPHDESGHTWHHPDPYLFAYTKFGGQGFMPEGQKSAMPGFGGQLSDREILAILAYIKSRWPDHIQERQARLTRRAADG